MRAMITTTALTALLCGCAISGAPLLEDEIRQPGSTQAQTDRQLERQTRDVRLGRAALPDRMAEIRAARRAGTAQAAGEVTPVLDPRGAIIAPAPTIPDARPAPFQPAPLPAVPARVGAPAGVGAQVGAQAGVGADPFSPGAASTAPFALRADRSAPPRALSSSAGQPVYPLDAPAQVEDVADETLASAQIGEPALPAAQPDAYAPDAAAVLRRINDYRARNGVQPLRYDPALSAVALAHVRDLAARGEVASTSADGTGVLARARAYGAEPSMASSLVAGGYADVDAALTTWRADKAQRDRLLMAEATVLGLAIVEDRRSPFRYYIEAIVAQD